MLNFKGVVVCYCSAHSRYTYIYIHSLKQFAPENRPLEKDILIGNHNSFRGYVSFREGIPNCKPPAVGYSRGTAWDSPVDKS